MLQVIDTFNSQKTTRHWSDEILRSLPLSELKEFSKWSGQAVKISEALEEKIAKHGKKPTAADKTAALRIASEQSVTKVTHLDPEQYIATNGGTIFYTPEHMIVHKLDGTEIKVVNSPIPLPMVGVTAQKQNVQHVAAMCSSVVRQKKALWESIGGNFSSILSRDQMDSSQLLMLSQLMVDVLEADPVWVTKTQVEKMAITEIRQLTFVMDVLNRLSDEAYHYITTFIVIVVLATFVNREGNWFRRMAQDRDGPAVADHMFSEIKLSAAQSRVYKRRFKMFPGVFTYNGGYIPKIMTADQDGSLLNATSALAQLRAVTGGDKSAILILSGMKDMSGYSSEFGKRIQFTLSATLAAWYRGYPVDIRLHTVGDMNVLMSSLQQLHKNFVKKLPEGVMMHEDPFKFLPMKRSPTSFAEAYRPYIITVHREAAIAIWYNDAPLPTPAEKGVRLDYDKVSYDLIPADMSINFIAYSTIYGALPFYSDPDVKDTVAKRVDFHNPYKHHTYAFGTASQFCGVLSSLSDLMFFGFGYTKDSRKPEFVEIPLAQYHLRAEWYNKVISDIRAAYCTLFGVRKRYSPISSLIHMSKKSVQLKLESPVEDADIFVSEVIRQKRKDVHMSNKAYSGKNWDDEPIDEPEVLPVRVPRMTTDRNPVLASTAPVPTGPRVSKDEYELPKLQNSEDEEDEVDDEDGSQEEEETDEDSVSDEKRSKRREKVDPNAVDPADI